MIRLLYSSGKDADMLYAVGVEIPDPFYFLDLGEGKEKFVFLDSREYGVFLEENEQQCTVEGRENSTALERCRITAVLTNPLFPEIRALEVGEGNEAAKFALYILDKYAPNGRSTSLTVSSQFTVALADALRAEGVELNPVRQLYPQRMLKTPQEVSAIRDSLKRTQSAFDLIESVLYDAEIRGEELWYKDELLTSELMKLMVEREFVEQQLMNVEGMIISSAEQAAIPHHRGSGPLRPNQTIICDIFPRHIESGYFADMTRTYLKGMPSTEQQKMFEAVAEAQQAGFDLIRPGVTGAVVHEACEQVFEARGFVTEGDRGFTHSTGHGLGLEVHEAPSLSGRETRKLQPGHVVTVEPGLYYKELGGVRIEDVVVVTEDGYENLTDYRNTWVIG